MLVLALLCGMMVPRVNVNTDMTKYLPADSEMKQGLDRMAEAMGEGAANMVSVRAMYHGLSDKERDSLAMCYRQMEGVQTLTSVQEKDGYVLYDLAVASDGDPKGIAAQIRKQNHDVVVETSIDGSLPDPIVIIIAALLVFAILFMMCESWMEPLLFLATIGIAVVLNVGSNVLLPSVSMTTNAIVAILQLVLSMDYSIILMNRYRQEVAAEVDSGRVAAMKRALAGASSSVLSSAFTTIAGLLMLCFMKFRIGMDLGIVLAKGVLCSVICLFTVLPSFILLFDKAIERSHKRVLVPKTDRLAGFEQRFRWPLTVAAVLIFGGSLFLHNRTGITFSTNGPTAITDIFPRQNTVVLLYPNEDEDKILDLAEALSLDDKVDTIVSYPTLMLRQQTADEMYASLKGLAAMLDPQAATLIDSMLTPELLSMVYALRQGDGADADIQPDALDEIVQIAEVAERADTAHKVPLVTVTNTPVGDIAPRVTVAVNADSLIATVPNPPIRNTQHAVYPQPTYRDTILTPMKAATLAAYLGFDAKQAATLYRMAGRTKGVMSPVEFVRYVNDKVLTNRMYASFISKDQKRQLTILKNRMEAALQTSAMAKIEADSTMGAMADTTKEDGKVLKQGELAANVDTTVAADTCQGTAATGIVPSVIQGIGEEVSVMPISTLHVPQPETTSTCSLDELVSFLTEDLLNDPTLSAFVDDSMRNRLAEVRDMMDQGVGQLKGKGWSMAAIVTHYDDEGEEIQQFLQNLRSSCDQEFGQYSLIGESVMFDEMRRGFGRELLLLSILTIAAIFLIVAFTFRSLVVPTVLVMTVLSGVYINVFISGIGGRTLLYLAYLIVQSILMGATIDYAILFTTYYRTNRRTLDVGPSLAAAYRGSIRTILTSGLIIVLAPGIMALLVEDRTISAIVGSLAVGGLVAILLILFVLPGCLAAFDRFVTHRR